MRCGKAIIPSADGQSVKLNSRSGISVNVRLDLAALGPGTLESKPVSWSELREQN